MKAHEIAVMIWNEFIVKTNNETIDFSFKDLEDKIKDTINNNMKLSELVDFYMWMQENGHDHNIRVRVEQKAKMYLEAKLSESVKRSSEISNLSHLLALREDITDEYRQTLFMLCKKLIKYKLHLPKYSLNCEWNKVSGYALPNEGVEKLIDILLELKVVKRHIEFHIGEETIEVDLEYYNECVANGEFFNPETGEECNENEFIISVYAI